MKVVYVVFMMVVSVYVITGMLIVAVQELKRSYWRDRLKRPTAFLNDVKEDNGEKYVEILVSIKEINEVRIGKYYLSSKKFSDDNVEAWRPLPPIYHKNWKKIKQLFNKKGK